jgi:hypothetical protein
MKSLIIRCVVAGLMIGSECFIGSAQSPTPTSSPTQDRQSDPLSDYQVPLPKEGLVPDKETAIKIAEVVLFRLYTEPEIIWQRPYAVKLENDVWLISGTMPHDMMGSVFKIAISKQTGEVLHLEH